MFKTINVLKLRQEIKEEVLKSATEDAERNYKNHQMETREIRKDHELNIKDLTFQMERETETQTVTFKGEIEELTKKLAVAENTIKMMDELTDLQTGMLDVKEVVNSLIKKLPNIDIKSITAGPSNS